MSDYIEGQSAATSLIGTPAIAIRQDTAGRNGNVTANQQSTRLQTDSYGNLRIANGGGAPTYFGASQFTADSTGTDIWGFPGVAGVTIKILSLEVTTTITSAATGDLTLFRRSTADTTGVTANATIAKADTRNATASGQPVHYTTHPGGLGTAAGIVGAKRLVSQAAGTVPATSVTFDFTPRDGEQELRLQGTGDFIYLNAASALTGSGNTWDIVVKWIELPTTA